MGRRNKPSGDVLNLDSLMDTLTNVVGFLVILLALTQMGVQEAVNRIHGIRTSVKPVSDEQLRQAKIQAEQVALLLEKLREQWKLSEDKSVDDKLALDRTRRPIEDLLKDLAQINKPMLSEAELKKLAEERRKQVEKLEQQILAANTQLSQLKSQLDDTPESGPGPEPKIIHLPNPRAAPSGAKVVYFVCRHGRLAIVELDELQGIAREQVKLVEKGRKDIPYKEVVDHLAKRNYGNTYFRVRCAVVNNAPYLVLDHHANTGETIEAFRLGASRFQRALRSIDPQKYYARFIVWSDSYEVYLEARQVAEKVGVLAGWEAYDANQDWRLSMLSMFSRTPDPNAKPPVKSTAPTDQID